MKPEVSVIIPTCNRRAMVAEAIASVMAQRGVAFELIVVDDGSTDGTSEWMRERFAGCETKCVRGESKPASIRLERIAHRGPAAARNRGVAMAQGAFIAFLDSDDLWMPDKLDRQIDFMRGNPRYAIAQTQELWQRNGRRVNAGRRHLKRPGDIFVESLRTCLVSPSAVMMKRELFDAAGGFDERLAACEDYDLWLRLLVDDEVGLLDEALVIRRAGHPDQLSAAMPALDRFRIITLLKLLELERLSAARRDAVADVLVEKCGIYAGGLERRGNREEAGYYRKLVRQAIGNRRLESTEAATLE